MPVALLCWQPVVSITDLREQIFHGGVVTMATGVAAALLAVRCA